MRDLRMVPVVEIVDGELPVAIDDELLHAGHDFHVALQGQEVEPKFARHAKVLIKRRSRGVVRGEDEPLEAVQLGNLAEAYLRPVEVLPIEVPVAGDPGQRPVNAVRPAMVRTEEALHIPLLCPTNGVAAVRTGVQHRLDAAILLAHYQHVVTPHNGLEEIAGFRDLGLVA